MQPILIHRGEFVAQRFIEVFDDFFIAIHALLLFAGATRIVLLSGRLELDVWPTRSRVSSVSAFGSSRLGHLPRAVSGEARKGALDVDLLTVRHT